MSEKVFEKAGELGQCIVESEAFLAVRKAEKDMLGDPNAQKLLKRFHELQQLQKEKQEKNESLTPEEAKEVEEIQLQVLENRTIKAYTEAQNSFQQMMNKTMGIIKDCGVNAAKEDAKE